MPWKEMDTMSLREEFINFALQAGSNVRALCRRYHISPRTAYKWLKRYKQEGMQGLADHSRRPHRTLKHSDEKTEAKVVEMRNKYGWGGRKIARCLADEGYSDIPHPNTITDILRRHGKLGEQECEKHKPLQHFERSQPNELEQMDYKGHFATLQGRCHPLTLLDDHSRFCLALVACADETAETTQGHLQAIFRQYGLPQAILCDNGPPWGTGHYQKDLSHLAVWLIRLGIELHHGRPAHPQTQGKLERFHGTLKRELLQGRSFANLADCQKHFDMWRDRYNLVRPHESLNLDTPAKHYQPSPLPFPETLPAVEYDVGEIVRKVQSTGEVTYHNREYRVGRGLIGQYVALRPTDTDGVLDVYFSHQKIRQIRVAQP